MPARHAIVTLALASFIGGAAFGQDLGAFTGTIGINADTASRQGEFAGCALNYRAAVQDYIYRQGALTAVSGSFNLNLMRDREGKKIVGGLLKVGLKQIDPSTNAQDEAPAFAYLASEQGSTAKSVVASDISDMPGYRILVLTIDRALVKLIGDILDGNAVTLYYSRTAHGLDVKVPLDMTVTDSRLGPSGLERIHSDATLRDFAACFQRLTEELR